MIKKIIILFLFLLILIACSDEKVKPKLITLNPEEGIPTQESWNSKIVFSENGDLKAILFSDYIRVYEDKKYTLLDGVKIDFYDEEGKKTSTLTSKEGKVEDDTQNMYAIDSVVAVSDSGRTLLTDELIWINRTRKIKTDKFVTILDKDERIEGYGFESDQSLQNYVIYNITYQTDLKED
ncbi:MAG: LPS export ABC transporter periplasmic protein LptC [Melioribacteraceae bacterium]|jgi:LPS export ABC transporter protein LptC|nr:LPS export ABC transporter periplasmic protein LptC [Melioribacteraceae bacterium]